MTIPQKDVNIMMTTTMLMMMMMMMMMMMVVVVVVVLVVLGGMVVILFNIFFFFELLFYFHLCFRLHPTFPQTKHQVDGQEWLPQNDLRGHKDSGLLSPMWDKTVFTNLHIMRFLW